MSKCKTKTIHTDLSTFRYNQPYQGITQAYSKLCVTLPYLEPWLSRTLTYSEPKATVAYM